ncbi:MAG: hypothetical protein ACOYU3_07620 [Bacillota bacterium]
MSHSNTRWAVSKTARQRNLLWTLPAILFFLLGLCFLAVFVINYVDGLLGGGHYLLLIISGNASAFLTLGIFSLILGGIFKLCAYLASLSCIKLYERVLMIPPSQSSVEASGRDEPPQTVIIPDDVDAKRPETGPGTNDL